MLQTAKTEGGSASKASARVLRLTARIRLTQDRLSCVWLAYGLHGTAWINRDDSRGSVKGHGLNWRGLDVWLAKRKLSWLESLTVKRDDVRRCCASGGYDRWWFRQKRGLRSTTRRRSARRKIGVVRLSDATRVDTAGEKRTVVLRDRDASTMRPWRGLSHWSVVRDDGWSGAATALGLNGEEERGVEKMDMKNERGLFNIYNNNNNTVLLSLLLSLSLLSLFNFPNELIFFYFK